MITNAFNTGFTKGTPSKPITTVATPAVDAAAYTPVS